MNYHTRREEADFIELIPVGDIHIGAPTSKAEQVLKLIKQSGIITKTNKSRLR